MEPEKIWYQSWETITTPYNTELYIGSSISSPEIPQTLTTTHSAPRFPAKFRLTKKFGQYCSTIRLSHRSWQHTFSRFSIPYGSPQTHHRRKYYGPYSHRPRVLTTNNQVDILPTRRYKQSTTDWVSLDSESKAISIIFSLLQCPSCIFSTIWLILNCCHKIVLEAQPIMKHPALGPRDQKPRVGSWTARQQPEDVNNNAPVPPHHPLPN